MSDPDIFQKTFSFTDFATAQPTTPLPGLQVDVQLDDISASTISLRDAVKDVRRADGALQNGIVTEDSLADGLLDAISSETGAAEAAASAEAAAISAAAADASADDAAVSAAELTIVAELIAAGGYYLDYGSITTPASSALDYGSIAA